MKQTIRRGVFETNSSSVHTLVVDKKCSRVPYPKSMLMYSGEYGWEVDKLDTPEEKLSYVYTSILSLPDEEERQRKLIKVSEILNSVGVEIEDFDPSNNKKDDEDEDDDYYCIDHVYDTFGFVSRILSEPELFLQFIFGKDSYIHTDNDNNDDMFSLEDEDSEDRFIYTKYN